MLKRLTSNRGHIIILLLFIQIGIATNCLAQLTIVADKATAMYEKGEMMNFQLNSMNSGEASYFIQMDRQTDTLASGTLDIVAGQVANIPFTLNEPGAVICLVKQGDETVYAGASFSPFDISPFEDEPDDFDQFWNEAKAALSTVSIDPQISFYDSSEYSTTYKVDFASIDNRRVYGFLSVPIGDGPFPAILRMPSFGSSPNAIQPDRVIAERGGALSLAISIHNAPLDEQDPNAYEPDVLTNADSLYFKNAVLAGVRAIDFIFARDDFDGRDIGVIGISQGGGLAFLIAGIDQRVKLMAQSIAAICENTAFKYGRPSGFPYYVQQSNERDGSVEHEEMTVTATKYIDGMIAAKRFTGPSLNHIGYRDTVAPPSTIFSAFNQLRGPKVLIRSRERGHTTPVEFTNRKFDFFRRHFEGMRNPPQPFVSSDMGYLIDAGEDQTIEEGETISLFGAYEKDGVVNDEWKREWKLVEGEGDVVFEDINAVTTNVTFNEPGKYTFQFSVEDPYDDEESRFYTISDYVTITVEEVVNVSNHSDRLKQFTIFPNPSTGVFELDIEFSQQQNFEIEVHDLLGKVVREYREYDHSFSKLVDLTSEVPGVYFVKLKMDDVQISKRLVLVK